MSKVKLIAVGSFLLLCCVGAAIAGSLFRTTTVLSQAEKGEILSSVITISIVGGILITIVVLAIQLFRALKENKKIDKK